MSNHKQILDECGCCKGVESLTPATVANNPGLSALAYRVGTHGSFKKTMLACLSTKPPLSRLTTRENDDPAIALLDAWAVVLDVLSFYQERMINEGYLRTATERRSILELARHISYKLNPGVAAGTYLAFTMEDTPGIPGAPGAPLQATIAEGTRVQSIPGQDELPQVYETVEDILAKVEWNAIKPRMTQPQNIKTDIGSIILKGTATNLKKGDVVLIIDSAGSQIEKRISEVLPDNETRTTRIDFDSPGLSPSSFNDGPSQDPDGNINLFPEKIELDEIIVEKIISYSWYEKDLSALFKVQGWSVKNFVTVVAELKGQPELPGTEGVYAFRNRAAVFGFNATKQPTYTSGEPDLPSQWTEWTPTGESGEKMFLDRDYEKILSDDYIVVQKLDGTLDTYQVQSAANLIRTEYGVSSKTTRLTLDSSWWTSGSINIDDIRSTSVYVESERLETADVPVENVVEGGTITLDGPYPELKKGQRVILTGERDDLKGIYVGETKILKEVILEAGFTVITFEESLEYSYVRNTVTINANVARATHGESKTEVLGSGDGSKTFQEFQLKQKPLTYVSAATTSGVETTLEIRVNNISWQEVPTFYGVSSEERIYVTRISDDGTITVQFGDGITGARLPTGVENVTATYRVGTGLEGMVDAGQLSLLMTKPLGVKGVINPLSSTGADDPEKRDQARQNAPLTVLTLDRIVSLSDYEDFTRAFAGIGKARADLLWQGEQRVVHITVAAADGGGVDKDSDLYKNLIAAIDAARHQIHRVEVDSYQLKTFDVKARVLVDSDDIVKDVLAAVSNALQETFSFGARDFGQDVTPSEVVAVMQAVEGVIAVDLEELGGHDPFAVEHFRLVAGKAHWDDQNTTIEAAQLLIINPDGIDIKEISS